MNDDGDEISFFRGMFNAFLIEVGLILVCGFGYLLCR